MNISTSETLDFLETERLMYPALLAAYLVNLPDEEDQHEEDHEAQSEKNAQHARSD